MNVTALDEQGQPVDWWFIYKVPQLGAGTTSDKASGYEYVYYDSTIDANIDPRKRTINKSDFTLNSGDGALNRTLDSVFKDFHAPTATTGWIMYNDEMPVSTKKHDDGTKGHTKGVLAFDTESNTAFWLLHSWPKFLDPDEDAEHDPTPMYGQTYLCISIDLDAANEIAAQMSTYQQPQVYFPQIPASLPDDAALRSLSKGLTPNPEPGSNIIKLKSIGVQAPVLPTPEGDSAAPPVYMPIAKMPFEVIAKNSQWNDDFWNDLVGPELNDDMNVETWIRGKVPPIMDKDGIHKTFDIKYINLGPLGAHWAWPETHDHAKWGITLHLTWICVGDINRMVSQKKRGGGTIAFQNQILWAGLFKTDLLLAPPGSTRTAAIDILKQTADTTLEAPLKGAPPSNL